ncbi:MAG TPA: polysaccharide biosynthesis tyrosine autokinase [Candidatus Baltobacteraceae bacterium]|nr:polysaccharide biosynthesis tyrosine autokinase [Candidatus Baltobacteraceae bacterium]
MNGLTTTTPMALTGGSVEPTVSDRQRELASLWRTIVRRRAAILQIFVGFVALVVIGTMVWPKSYTTTIKVIAGNENGPAADDPSTQTNLPVLNALVLASGMQTSETYAELFVETPVVQRVIDQLDLHVSPDTLLKHVTVAPITNTNILAVSVSWKDAVTSAAIANAFGQAILQRERDLVSSQANAALSNLSQQLPAAQTRMNDAQNRLTAFETTHRIANIDEQTQATITNMAALDAKLDQTQTDLQQAQAQLASDDSQMRTIPANITGNTTTAQNPVVASLQNQLTQVDVQLQQDEQQYTNKYPAVIALKAQQTQLQRQIAKEQQTVVANTSQVPNPVYQQLQQQAEQARSQAAADNAQVAELQRQLHDAQPALAALPAQAAQLADLQRSAKSAQDVYSALQQKYVDARVASETAISDVTITQPASPAGATVRPSLMLNFLISLVLGLVLGVTGALVLDYLDNSIRDEREVEEELAIPQVGSVPFVQLRNGAPIVPWVKALALDSFLQLVTNIKYSTDQPLRSLTITSPAQGDGKSTVALNVALALNEIDGSVLLVDGDLRRPSLHAKLHLPNERGLSDVLVGACSIAQAVQIDKRTGLAIMTSGTAAPNPIKLLESPRFDDLLEELYTRYKILVFDGAALANNLDSAVLAHHTTGTVLVVSQGTSDLRAASSAVKRLGRMGARNVLGFVMNRVEPRRADYAPYGEELPSLLGDDAPIVVAQH